MRNGQNKRMRGRNRNKGHHGGGGGHHHNPLTRVYESNGPEVKIRGTAHHIAEKYLQLARDAQSGGDPVTAENYYQHAEHYFRLIAAAQEQLRQQNPYYQAPAAPGEASQDDVFDGDEDDTGQPVQRQPNFGAQNVNGQQGANAAQPYPPREQPQPYGGPPPSHQGRPQQQPQPSYNAPQSYQPQPAPPAPAVGDAGQLPSFITGAQPQPSAQGTASNGQDGNAGGDRFPRHRRRRHRSSGPRPEMANGSLDFRGDDGPDVPSN